MKKTLSELQSEIGLWQARTFGAHDTATGKAAHIKKEAAELSDQLKLDGELPTPEVSEETADIVILACGVAAKCGFDLAEAIERKMAINRTRKWSGPDGEGVCSHLTEAERLTIPLPFKNSPK